MSRIAELHNAAMKLAEKGELARLGSDAPVSQEAFKEALELEKQAAELAGLDAQEPDRSVLYRSAASLALDCNEIREAERLLASGLSGEPPPEIADEMRDLLEQVNFQRHLEVRGWELETSEIQMAIAGEAIGYGVASTDEFVGRVQDFERLILRTAERRLGIPYREGGSPRKALRDQFELYLSVPRAASFAVTLKLGRPKEQMSSSVLEGQPDVIDEVMDLLEIAQEQSVETLEQRIPETAYRRNFIALAKKLAPDGDDVSLVGFTSIHEGMARRLALTTPRRDLEGLSVSRVKPTEKRLTVQGVLHFADQTGGASGTIKLEQDGTIHLIKVPEGMMADIVKPLWDETVRVTGILKGKAILLDEIERVDD